MSKLESLDPAWASWAEGEIDRLLVETGIRAHVDNWIVDCRSTACTVCFGSALADYDLDKTAEAMTQSVFRRAIWHQDFRENTSYLVLVRSDTGL